MSVYFLLVPLHNPSIIIRDHTVKDWVLIIQELRMNCIEPAAYFLRPSKMADRESVLLEVINTKHKKTGGTLRLMSNNLIWVPYGSDNPKLSCAYSEIKGKKFVNEVI